MKEWILVLLAVFVCGGLLSADDKKAGDPNDIWYRAFVKAKQAKELEEKGEFLKAYQATEESFEGLKQLALLHGDFHPAILNPRLQLLAEQKEKLRRLIGRDGKAVDRSGDAANKALPDDQVKRQGQTGASEKKLKDGAELGPEKREAKKGFVDENGVEYLLVPTGKVDSARIPKNWIPREFEGQMTYIIPLIETPETTAFSTRKMVPAISK